LGTAKHSTSVASVTSCKNPAQQELTKETEVCPRKSRNTRKKPPSRRYVGSNPPCHPSDLWSKSPGGLPRSHVDTERAKTWKTSETGETWRRRSARPPLPRLPPVKNQLNRSQRTKWRWPAVSTRAPRFRAFRVVCGQRLRFFPRSSGSHHDRD
jgi:hypothetical protein